MIISSACKTAKTTMTAPVKVASPVEYAMTVIRIMPDETDPINYQINFQFSPRIFKLPKTADAQYLILLKESLAKNVQVMVAREREESDIITSVKRIN